MLPHHARLKLMYNCRSMNLENELTFDNLPELIGQFGRETAMNKDVVKDMGMHVEHSGKPL